MADATNLPIDGALTAPPYEFLRHGNLPGESRKRWTSSRRSWHFYQLSWLRTYCHAISLRFGRHR